MKQDSLVLLNCLSKNPNINVSSSNTVQLFNTVQSEFIACIIAIIQSIVWFKSYILSLRLFLCTSLWKLQNVPQ